METRTQTEQQRQKTQPGQEPRTNFETVIKELRKGAVILECQEHLQDVVAAVRSTGKKGEVTVKLSIEPRTPGDPSEVVIDGKVISKQPEPVRPKTIFFTTDMNKLQRQDPRQGTLEGIG